MKYIITLTPPEWEDIYRILFAEEMRNTLEANNPGS